MTAGVMGPTEIYIEEQRKNLSYIINSKDIMGDKNKYILIILLSIPYVIIFGLTLQNTLYTVLECVGYIIKTASEFVVFV